MTPRRWAVLVVALYLTTFVAAGFGAWLLAVAMFTAPSYVGIGWLLRGRRAAVEVERLTRENERLRARDNALEDELTSRWNRRMDDRYAPWPDNGQGYRSPRFTPSDSPTQTGAELSQGAS